VSALPPELLHEAGKLSKALTEQKKVTILSSISAVFSDNTLFNTQVFPAFIPENFILTNKVLLNELS
jgi:hypothetical protein